MKKYVVGLLLLVMQNICAMQIDPFQKCLENDEKCKWVARYLHRYPQGKNEDEAEKIELFFDEPKLDSGFVLPMLVNKYQNIFAKIETNEYLHCIYKEQFPSDVRRKIVTEALYFSAREYYGALNTFKFLGIYKTVDIIHCKYIFHGPYFVTEIDEKDVEMYFELPKGGLQPQSYNHCPILRCPANRLMKFVYYYGCDIAILEKLESFLNEKDARVNAFKVMFNNCTNNFLLMDEQEGINEFIRLLNLFNILAQRINSSVPGNTELI